MKPTTFFSHSPPPKKQKKDSDLEIDFFSQLPDHIIGSVLSRLPLKDAVRTSVLARRWEKLWSFRLGSDIILRVDEFERRKPREFVAWVDRILKSCREQKVGDFAISYGISRCFSDALKSWLLFASQKKVNRLDLDLALPMFNADRTFDCVFPDFRKLSHEFSNLKDVCLSGINTDQTAFQYFLSKCPSLENLRLRGVHFRNSQKHFRNGWKRFRKGRKRFRNGRTLATLKVKSQTLKCLEVVRCNHLQVVMSAPKLIPLSYSEQWIALEFESAPLLSELTVGGNSTEVFVKQFGSNFGFATQLTTLKLELSMMMVENSVFYPQELTAFPVLKYLEITMEMDEDQWLLWPICLINAAPMLHTFKVEMRSLLNGGWQWETYRDSESMLRIYVGRNLSSVKISRHKCLKVVECHGFTHFANHWELVNQILEISESLEKIVLLDVDAVSIRFSDFDDEFCDNVVINSKRTGKRLLETSGVKLEVINSISKGE